MKTELLIKILVPIVAVAVVLLGIGFAVVRSMLAKKTAEAREKWVRGAYSIWTGGEDSGSWAQQRAKSSLESWYGINNSQTFWATIKELRQGQTESPAWDKVRALDILRIGVAAGHIDAEACFNEAGYIGAELQKLHHSWDALAQAFEAGMQAWQRRSGITDPNETGRVQRNLPALRQQIWPAVPYGTNLVIED